MRISDWSSDVCSSDLLSKVQSIKNHQFDKNSTSKIVILLSHLERCQKRIINFQRFALCWNCELCTYRPHFRCIFPYRVFRVPDRKSVVSGKSVYVRVDLGGRGIIKYNKKK